MTLLGVALLLGLGLGFALSGHSSTGARIQTQFAAPPSAAPQSSTPVPAATPQPQPMPLRRALGQKIVASYYGTQVPRSLLRAAWRGHIGGVILFKRNIAGIAAVRHSVARLQAAARRGHNPPLLVMVDQEGGSVKRFDSLAPRRSPQQIGAAKDPAGTALAAGAATGRGLRAVGVNMDLAPVADVPVAPASFLGDRAFGNDPTRVADAACSFAAGLERSGVAATFKHFPGLGRAAANTDLQATAVGATGHQLEHDALPYRRCGAALPLVMVSSAAYPQVSGNLPAVLSRSIYRRVLPRTGFRGVTISDDLETPALAALPSPGRRAINAGLDLLLYGRSESTAELAYSRLRADLAAHRLSVQKVRRSAERIVALKQRYAR